MKTRQPLALMLVSFVLASALAGCGSSATQTNAGTDTTDDCAKQLAGDSSAKPVVVLLTPLGNAQSTSTNSHRIDLDTVIEGATGMEARLIVSGIGGGVDAPNLVVNTTMVGTGPNKMLKSQNVDCKRDAVTAEYSSLKKQPSHAKLDVVSALATAKADLKDVNAPVHVVVFGSALNESNQLDLTNPKVLGDPAGAINRLAKDRLNFRCDNWRVYLIGSGTHRGKSIAPKDDAALKRFWSTYFNHCGGKLVTYNTRLPAFPLEDKPIEAAYTKTLAVTIERRENAVVATLPSDILFSVNDAKLRTGAAKGLSKVSPELQGSRGEIVVAGHTDSTGDASFNKSLSLARAKTVATWLERRSHIDRARLRLRGLGESQPVASNATEKARALNRRVVVTFHR